MLVGRQSIAKRWSEQRGSIKTRVCGPNRFHCLREISMWAKPVSLFERIFFCYHDIGESILRLLGQKLISLRTLAALRLSLPIFLGAIFLSNLKFEYETLKWKLTAVAGQINQRTPVIFERELRDDNESSDTRTGTTDFIQNKMVISYNVQARKIWKWNHLRSAWPIPYTENCTMIKPLFLWDFQTAAKSSLTKKWRHLVP